MTKTFRDNCDINNVQQTSCEPLLPDVQMQLQTYFFVPFVPVACRRGANGATAPGIQGSLPCGFQRKHKL